MFTRALLRLLGSESRVYAIDRDPKAIARLERLTGSVGNVIPVVADIAQLFELPERPKPELDGDAVRQYPALSP